MAKITCTYCGQQLGEHHLEACLNYWGQVLPSECSPPPVYWDDPDGILEQDVAK